MDPNHLQFEDGWDLFYNTLCPLLNHRRFALHLFSCIFLLGL
jgi:hypothetical protein